MLSGKLLPAHLHVLPDELLTSWLARLARAHELKLQSFSQLLFGRTYQLWNRDLDRLSPLTVVARVAELTGTAPERAWQSTLGGYEGVVYPRHVETGILRWVLNVGVYHRTRLRFGLQVCPRCLAADSDPYFRRSWRLAFVVCCPTHQVNLIDECPVCRQPLAFHRTKLGQPEVGTSESLTVCGTCRTDLRDAKAERATDNDLVNLAAWHQSSRESPLDRLAVLHQFARILLSARRGRRLYKLMAADSDVVRSLPPSGRCHIELLRLRDRLRVLECAMFLMRHPRQLTHLIEQRLLRYNELLRDFRDAPTDYRKWVQALPHRGR